MTRRRLAVLVSLSIATLLFGQTAVAGVWDDEFPITQDPVVQYRFYPTVDPANVLYVLWPDWTDWEDTQIMLMRSADKGATWTEPEAIFGGQAYDNMALHADAAGLHLLLVEFYEEQEEYKFLYYAKSTDGGEYFTDPVRIGEQQNIEAIKLFSSPGMLYIYAQNYDHELEEAFNYLYVSDDGGENWVEKPLLPGWTVQNPAFTTDEGVLHMVFGGLLVDPEIMHSMSSDAGDSWSPPVEVSAGAGTHSQLPQVAVDQDAIHVTWEDDREDHFNVMYSRSTDGGVTWSADQRINDTLYGARARLLADEEGLHIAWCQYHGDNGWPSSWSSADYGILWYKFSDDSGVGWSDEFRISQNEHIPPINLPAQGANYVQLAEYGTGFCAIWLDKRDGNIDLYMRNNQGVPTDVPDRLGAGGSLAARPLWASPARGPVEGIAFRIGSDGNGQIACQLVDLQGRILARMAARSLTAAEDQLVGWHVPPLGEGVYFVRLVLVGGGECAVHRLVVVP